MRVCDIARDPWDLIASNPAVQITWATKVYVGSWADLHTPLWCHFISVNYFPALMIYA